MNTAVIVTTPEELASLISQAMAPLCERIGELESKVAQHKDLLTVQDIADRAGTSPDTVRDWITKGREVPGQKGTIKLKVTVPLQDNRHHISWTAWQEFLSQFRDRSHVVPPHKINPPTARRRAA